MDVILRSFATKNLLEQLTKADLRLWLRMTTKNSSIFDESTCARGHLPLEDVAKNLAPESYGLIDSGKYFEGAQILTVKLLQPRIRNSRMIRI